MTKTLQKINPDNWYTMQDIVREKMFPWSASSFSSVRRIVTLDTEGKNILKATVRGEGTGKKYHIKGENIIKFISAVESGKVRL